MTYPVTIGDGRSTEELVAAGHYGYAHSCVTSENFPVRPGPRARHIALLVFDREVSAREAIALAAAQGLERPVHEDALAFGAAHPDVQRGDPIVFLHEPWLGYFGRWDVLCLWENAGRRELGLEDFETRWRAGYRFAFIRAAGLEGPESPNRPDTSRRSRGEPPSRVTPRRPPGSASG